MVGFARRLVSYLQGYTLPIYAIDRSARRRIEIFFYNGLKLLQLHYASVLTVYSRQCVPCRFLQVGTYR